MAKKTISKTTTKTRVKVTGKGKASTASHDAVESTLPSSNFKVSDYDPDKVTSKEVNVTSETAQQVQQGMILTNEVSERVAKRWEERVARDGSHEFYSPFDPRDKRTMFKTKKACSDYMKKKQKNRITQAKLTGEPFEPIQVTVSPKRTLADFVDPTTARFQQAANESAAAMAGLTKQIVTKSKGAGHTPVARLLILPESMAIGQIKALSDDDLQTLHVKAGSFGKKDLTRSARVELKSRGLPVSFR